MNIIDNSFTANFEDFIQNNNLTIVISNDRGYFKATLKDFVCFYRDCNLPIEATGATKEYAINELKSTMTGSHGFKKGNKILGLFGLGYSKITFPNFS